jgi:hypothetical protein
VASCARVQDEERDEVDVAEDAGDEEEEEAVGQEEAVGEGEGKEEGEDNAGSRHEVLRTEGICECACCSAECELCSAGGREVARSAEKDEECGEVRAPGADSGSGSMSSRLFNS